jgi:DNA-binding IclR family transcriptional regulator
MSDRINSVDRAFQILEYLKIQNRSVNISSLARQLKIPRSSVFRIIKTLEKRGYVIDVDNIGGYILGSSIISLGAQSDYVATLRQTAGPHMYELAKTTGQTVQLGLLFEYEVMYVDQIQASGALSVSVPSEKPFPVNLSAGGKVLTAHLPQERIEELLRYTVFSANTPRTITDKEEFRQELVRVCQTGVGFDDEEFARGIRCLAAPVFNNQGRNILSIGITGHLSEITDTALPDFKDKVIATAKRLSRALGYDPTRG